MLVVSVVVVVAVIAIQFCYFVEEKWKKFASVVISWQTQKAKYERKREKFELGDTCNELRLQELFDRRIRLKKKCEKDDKKVEANPMLSRVGFTWANVTSFSLCL